MKLIIKFWILVILAQTIFLPIPPVFAADWGPWLNKTNSLSVMSGKKQKSAVSKLFYIYQRQLSSQDGAACPFYPTCSAFAYQALTKHGFFYGSLLSLDRLLSEYPGMPKSNLYPLITVYGLHRPYDPVP